MSDDRPVSYFDTEFLSVDAIREVDSEDLGVGISVTDADGSPINLGISLDDAVRLARQLKATVKAIAHFNEVRDDR